MKEEEELADMEWLNMFDTNDFDSSFTNTINHTVHHNGWEGWMDDILNLPPTMTETFPSNDHSNVTQLQGNTITQKNFENKFEEIKDRRENGNWNYSYPTTLATPIPSSQLYYPSHINSSSNLVNSSRTVEVQQENVTKEGQLYNKSAFYHHSDSDINVSPLLVKEKTRIPLTAPISSQPAFNYPFMLNPNNLIGNITAYPFSMNPAMPYQPYMILPSYNHPQIAVKGSNDSISPSLKEMIQEKETKREEKRIKVREVSRRQRRKKQCYMEALERLITTLEDIKTLIKVRKEIDYLKRDKVNNLYSKVRKIYEETHSCRGEDMLAGHEKDENAINNFGIVKLINRFEERKKRVALVHTIDDIHAFVDVERAKKWRQLSYDRSSINKHFELLISYIQFLQRSSRLSEEQSFHAECPLSQIEQKEKKKIFCYRCRTKKYHEIFERYAYRVACVDQLVQSHRSAAF